MVAETVPVERLMSTELVTVTSDTPVEEAATALLDEDVGSLIVLGGAEQLVGLLTSTDLVEIVSDGRAPAGETVGEFMTEDVATVGPTDSIHDAAVTMTTEGIQHLPVTGTENEMVGMLSSTDLTAQLTYMTSSGTD